MSEEKDLSFDIKTAKAADVHAVKLTKFSFVHYIAGGLGSTGVFLARTDEGEWCSLFNRLNAPFFHSLLPPWYICSKDGLCSSQ
eukprot:m.47714 g.47714  ORF g.47714 m.47714 type:complete len:84 (+) comp10785_c0_seq3:151-402(+)